jgi:hypothetical protein
MEACMKDNHADSGKLTAMRQEKEATQEATAMESAEIAGTR